MFILVKKIKTFNIIILLNIICLFMTLDLFKNDNTFCLTIYL